MRLVVLVVALAMAVLLNVQEVISFHHFGRSFSLRRYPNIHRNSIGRKKLAFFAKFLAINEHNKENGTLQDESKMDEFFMHDEGEELKGESHQNIMLNEFFILSGGKEELRKESFFQWDEIQHLVEDELVSKETIEQLWTKYASSSQTVNVDSFVAINNDIDDLLELWGRSDDGRKRKDGIVTISSRIPTKNANSSNNLMELEDIIESTVWFPGINPETLFEKEFLLELSNSFAKLTDGSTNGQLSFHAFQNWDDIARLTKEANLNDILLQTLWKEAVEYQYVSEELKEKDVLNRTIDVDTFYRLSYRLDDLMNELQAIIKEMTDEENESFYRSEFAVLTKGEKFLTYDKFIQWPFLQETLKMNVESFSIGELQNIWNAFPKKVNDLGESVIDEGDFLVLNEAIENAIVSLDIPATVELDDEVNNILQ
jgi:hypothetical protein